ncbi:6291_t:CDS:2 [Acaulospora morrowiae]|uniref:6291_t:CDS:1 n=1 Tax=Acaulospora morrowiae TaxID=94023 RepID=A0A9N9DCK0_9GLOM|nr:6291_t:CDS:2 [Acaulospora morrowiae]
MKFTRHTLAFLIASALAVCVCSEETTEVDNRPEFKPTTIQAPFLEQFTDDWLTRWSPSEATKENKDGGETFSYVGKWIVEEPNVYPGIKGDKGLVAKSAAAHHAISAPLKTPLDNTGKTLVVQ